MWQHFLATENLMFSVAITVMLILAVLEGVASLIGAGFSSALESLLPDTDVTPHAEVGNSAFEGSLSRVLGWLRIGQVPILMLLVLGLTIFGLTGLLGQALVYGLVGFYLPGWLASLPVLAITFPLLRFWGGILHAIMPKDETTAVSEESLIGRVAVITLGNASTNNPAQAKARDSHGMTHYFQVIPDQPDDIFPQGAKILLISLDEGTYRAIPAENPSLTDN